MFSAVILNFSSVRKIFDRGTNIQKSFLKKNFYWPLFSEKKILGLLSIFFKKTSVIFFFVNFAITKKNLKSKKKFLNKLFKDFFLIEF